MMIVFALYSAQPFPVMNVKTSILLLLVKE